jgi:ABC-type glycerol-3-phosphate transport system substrate-binding protein
VYRDVYFTVPPDSFGAMLESPVPYLFPAGADQNVSTTFLYHYLSSGGTLIDEDGKPHLDVDPLRTILTFYLSAREKGIIDNTLFQISDTSETWGNYRDLGAGLATVSSTQYLAERQAARPSRTTWIPTVNGQPYALVSGWSWAIVAHDPDQQAAAMALLNFLMNPVNQGKFARAAGWVPSQQAALNVWGEDDAYLAFSSTVLSNAHPMPDPILRAAVGPALQAAVENVMLQDMLPAQAATQAAQTINIGP